MYGMIIIAGQFVNDVQEIFCVGNHRVCLIGLKKEKKVCGLFANCSFG